MRHGSLFSGIGGFDLAAEWMGYENVFHCEWNPFGQRVLKYYLPKATSYEDITKTDFTIHRGEIDILTGGFPCQPYSAAGKRLGKEDDRHLWPEMLRAIREIHPTWVVGENVRGLINWNGGMVFDEVQADLEAEGYEVTPFLLPACAVNAPHRRDRIWFVAYANSYSGGATKSNFIEEGQHVQRGASRFGIQRATTNTTRSSGKEEYIKGQRQRELRGRNSKDDATNTRLLRSEISEKQATRIKQCDKGDATNTISSGRIQNNKQQSSTELKYACTSWERFPTQSPICSGDDGLPTELDGITFPKWRSESIKAYGNAIVPQVAYQIFQAIKSMTTIIKTQD